MKNCCYEGPLELIEDENWMLCDEPVEECQEPTEEIAMEDFYAVPHQSEFLEHGILSSTPLALKELKWRGKLRKMTLAYYRMNLALEVGLETGRVRFGKVDSVLSPKEKKAVRNWVQNGKTGPTPLRVTITGRQNGGLILTKEYGALPMVDITEVPQGLKTASIYRFETPNGRYFRLGLRRQDLKAEANGAEAETSSDEFETSRAKSEQSLRQVQDKAEDFENMEPL